MQALGARFFAARLPAADGLSSQEPEAGRFRETWLLEEWAGAPSRSAGDAIRSSRPSGFADQWPSSSAVLLVFDAVHMIRV